MHLLYLVMFLLGVVVAVPHKGMVDEEDHRDVGVVYSQTKYQGTTQFIYEYYRPNQCNKLNHDATTNNDGWSIKVCKKTQCVFYTGTECENSDQNFSIAVGCGDVESVETPEDTGKDLRNFNSYICGNQTHTQELWKNAKYRLTSKPHDPATDM